MCKVPLSDVFSLLFSGVSVSLISSSSASESKECFQCISRNISLDSTAKHTQENDLYESNLILIGVGQGANWKSISELQDMVSCYLPIHSKILSLIIQKIYNINF